MSKKLGRPKLDNPKSKAELQKEFRANMRKRGYRTATFWVRRDLSIKAKKLAVINGIPQWQQYNYLLEKGIKQELKEIKE